MAILDEQLRPYAQDKMRGRARMGDFEYSEDELRRKRRKERALESGNFDSFDSMDMDALRKYKVYGAEV